MSLLGSAKDSGPESLIRLARTRAADEPDRVLFTHVSFAPNKSAIRSELTRAQVMRRARNLGARLAAVTEPGERVAVLAPQDLNYVIGFLGAIYAGCVAVPLFNPKRDGSRGRLVTALNDCDAAIWLSSGEHLDAAADLLDDGVPSPPREIVPIDGHDESWGETFEGRHHDLAYLQYTSGTTRAPRGVMISHSGLIANVRQLAEAFDAWGNETCVGLLPLHHDMGLLLTVCVPAATGIASEFMDPMAFLKRPARWLDLLHKAGPVYTAASNLAYDFVTNRVRPEDLDLDLSRVKAFLIGGEPVRPDTVERFTKTFARLNVRPASIRPSYGLAEATVFVATTENGMPPTVTSFSRKALQKGVVEPVPAGVRDAVRLVACGQVTGQQLRVVAHDSGEPLGPGRVGEIWLRGPNIAQGYWERKEETSAAFKAALDGTADWLRTGDLGFIHKGSLFVTGRLVDLITVDGLHHFAEDLEDTVSDADPQVRRERVAAFQAEVDGRTGAVVLAEHSGRPVPGDETVPGDVEARVRDAVTERHGLALLDFRLVRPGTLRVTTSGKIARAECRRRYLAGQAEPEG